MQRAWRIAGAVFAMLFAVWAHQSWQLSLQDALGPGPGFFPFFLSLIGVVLAVVLIFKPRQESAEKADDELPLIPAGDALRKIILTFVALVVVTALLDVIGYPIAMAAFCLCLLYVLGARNWWVIITFSLAASFGVELLFADLLKVPLPVGMFGF